MKLNFKKKKVEFIESIEQLIDSTKKKSLDLLSLGEFPKGQSLNDFPYLNLEYFDALEELKEINAKDPDNIKFIIYGLDLKYIIKVNDFISSDNSRVDYPDSTLDNLNTYELNFLKHSHYGKLGSRAGFILPSYAPYKKEFLTKSEIDIKNTSKYITFITPKGYGPNYSIINIPRKSISLYTKKSKLNRVFNFIGVNFIYRKLKVLLHTEKKALKIAFVTSFFSTILAMGILDSETAIRLYLAVWFSWVAIILTFMRIWSVDVNSTLHSIGHVTLDNQVNYTYINSYLNKSYDYDEKPPVWA